MTPGNVPRPGVRAAGSISFWERRKEIVWNRMWACWRDDSGMTIENLMWYVIVGLGTAAIAFGINAGQRVLGGKVRADIQGLEP